MSEKSEIRYKNARIEFDSIKNEWVAYLNDISTGGEEDEFKRHFSLEKLKAAIDRFNKKEFSPIPILIFNHSNDIKNAEIISFTNKVGECWIRHYDDNRREKINTLAVDWRGNKAKKIYACGNIPNEPLVTRIFELDDEIKKIQEELAQKIKERIHLISSLQQFDISGYVESDYDDSNEVQ
jgi:hypothetical protein